MMGLFSGNDDTVRFLVGEVHRLQECITKLENEARYIADQPKTFADGGFLAWQMAQNAYQNGINLNQVPINEVVKAIVKHLGMEIEKVAEHTINKPMEVKVVEKGVTGATLTGNDGVAMGTTWANPVYPTDPKPKRKYTKRKPAVKTGGKKNA
jgi:hypothetical protein